MIYTIRREELSLRQISRLTTINAEPAELAENCWFSDLSVFRVPRGCDFELHSYSNTTVRMLTLAVVFALAVTATACSRPNERGLRESFAQQVSANQFVTDFAHRGDELTFSGPGIGGGIAKWRVHIDSTVIEPPSEKDAPYKGTVKSSWYANGRRIEPVGSESNLPFELLENGIAQECWALWDETTKRWSWE
jgi:hypothetical protein